VIQVTTRADLQRAVQLARAERRRIGFVPTMGFLHEGHLSLIDRAHAAAEFVVLSIFVNPLQFSPGEDLERYPRDVPRDLELARHRGVHLVFTPATPEMYSAEPAVVVDAPDLVQRLCGKFRPGHFRGVLTIVAKLFHLVRPDVAVFGQKDYQQLTLIRRMVKDLDMPVEIVAGPIVREDDGLALSSRNVYLSPDERRDAALLYGGLQAAQRAFANGERSADRLRHATQEQLGRGTHITPQYIELVAPDTLESVAQAKGGDVLAIAAFVGKTRLIDNHVLTEAPS
jgi:pantoate--beta-alanine ligase